MLKTAYFYQGELYECIKQLFETDSSSFFFLSYPQKDFFPQIYATDFDFLQFVSVDSMNNVIGYMSGKINHEYEKLENLEVINFSGRPNIIFSKDILNYFDKVFLYKHLRKIEFSCVENNPCLAMYRRLMKKIDGNEVGIFHDSVKLTDGVFYNNVMFEIIRENYQCAMKKKYPF